MERTKGFWRNFTLKKWILSASVLFIATLLVAMAFNYFDRSETVRSLFTRPELLKRIFTALLVGFWLAAWFKGRRD
jgi:hypothetical protein